MNKQELLNICANSTKQENQLQVEDLFDISKQNLLSKKLKHKKLHTQDVIIRTSVCNQDEH